MPYAEKFPSTPPAHLPSYCTTYILETFQRQSRVQATTFVYENASFIIIIVFQNASNCVILSYTLRVWPPFQKKTNAQSA